MLQDVAEELTDTVHMREIHTTQIHMTIMPELVYRPQFHMNVTDTISMNVDCHHFLHPVTRYIVTLGDIHLITTADLHHLEIHTMNTTRDAGETNY